MKLGVRAHDYGRHGIAEYAKLLRDEGYQAAQVAIPKCFTGVERYEDITEPILHEIREAFDREQIEIAVLGCYQDLGNPDEKIREYAVKTFKDCLGYCKILGARMTGSETSYAHLKKMEKHQWFPYMMESLKELTEEAERLDVWMGIEPVGWHPLEDMDTAREVLDTLGSDHVKIILDPANILERPDEINQKAYWKRCFETLGDAIQAIHLKDFVVNEAGGYEGRLLGHGIMDYSVLSEWLKRHPDMPVLREEMDPAHAKEELQFMRTL